MTNTASRTQAHNPRGRLPLVASSLIGLTLAVWLSMTAGPAPETLPPVARSELPESTPAEADPATAAVMGRVEVDSPRPPSPPPPPDESAAAPTVTTTPTPAPEPVEPVVTTTTMPAPVPTTTPPDPAPPEPPPPADPMVDDGIGGQDPGSGDLLARVQAAFESSVTDPWRTGLPVRFELKHGYSSMAYTDGTIRMSRHHARGDWERLRAIVSHEFGHVIAFRYGSGHYLGAPPDGWPESGRTSAERWSDCVARGFTGYPLGSHHGDPCSGDPLAWTIAYLAAGPPA